MNEFNYRDGQLYAEDCKVSDIVAEVGTPVYIYSQKTLERHFNVFDEAMGGLDHLICFSVKSNSNLAVLRLFANLGGGADIVSGGELFRCLKAGMEPNRVVFSGVGKTREEIRYALESGIMMFNVESEMELEEIQRVASEMGKIAPISFRVNPDIDPKTHPYISTGLKKNKFGVEVKQAVELYRKAAGMDAIEILGIDCHIGSQLTTLSPFEETVLKLREIVEDLEREGIQIRWIDLGGGLGITYNDETPPSPEAYAKTVRKAAEGMSQGFIFEPGRVMAGNAGILVTRVLYVKQGPVKTFIVVDAGMNDMVRPSLYGAYQEIQPVVASDAKIVADVVGPICESGDFLAKEREVPNAKPGELLSVMSAGAYGFTMASNYNSRPRPAEVMVNGEDYFVIRRRETYEDLVRGEQIPPWLS
ncbi:MAG: diaminopimelate decarboxylase [Deltaproteobacteria bacterium]|nr:diaminopimelate decarboxylase [Deltaproteobacteria bacterium]